jgi:hypothetical protein
MRAMPKFADMMPVYSARRRTVTTIAMMERVPDIRPAAPIPAIKRPMISILEDVAAPEIADPISKMRKRMRKVHYILISLCDISLGYVHTFREKLVYNLPLKG